MVKTRLILRLRRSGKTKDVKNQFAMILRAVHAAAARIYRCGHPQPGGPPAKKLLTGFPGPAPYTTRLRLRI
jgi:hypothetical protein